MSSTEEDESQFENFMSALRNDRKKETPSMQYRQPKNEAYHSPEDSRRRLRRFSSDSSSENESAFEIFVSSLKSNRVGIDSSKRNQNSRKNTGGMDSFIVDDDIDVDEESSSQGSDSDTESGSENRNSLDDCSNQEEEEEEGGFESTDSDDRDPRHLFVKLQLEDEERLERKILRCSDAPKLDKRKENNIKPSSESEFSSKPTCSDSGAKQLVANELLLDSSERPIVHKEVIKLEEGKKPEGVAESEPEFTTPPESKEITAKHEIPLDDKNSIKADENQEPDFKTPPKLVTTSIISKPRDKSKSAKCMKIHEPERHIDVDADFLYNLSAEESSYIGMSDEARKLKRKFARTRLDISKRVAEIINRRCFDSKLPMNVVSIEFTKRLLKTAGDTTTKGPIGLRTCLIRLAEKVCDSPGRTRDTLIHELCHAAVTMIDGVLHHRHGHLWIRWTKIVAKVFPKLPPVTVCHRYQIQTKYTYACVSCGQKYGRHSKSININTQRCGICHGVLRLVDSYAAAEFVGTLTEGEVQHKTPPKSERRPNAWTSFVSSNFASIKKEMPKSAHKDIMARLKVLYQSERAVRTRPSEEDAPPPLTPLVAANQRPRSAEIDEHIDLILANSFNVNVNL